MGRFLERIFRKVVFFSLQGIRTNKNTEEKQMEKQYYDIERRTAIKEEARLFRRKFLTYEQAGVIYSMSHRKLRDIA